MNEWEEGDAVRNMGAHLARMLMKAAPVRRARRPVASSLFPFLRQDVCRVARVSHRLAPDLRMMLRLDEYYEFMLWMLADFNVESLEACKPYVPRDGICVDVGAHVGHWSLVFSRFVGAGGHVYAFEPFPPFFQRLEHNIALNEARNVTPVQCALGNEIGTLEFEGAACHLAWKERSPVESRIQVPCGTLSDFIEKNEIPRLDFVKLVIEGSELLALRGMERHFKRGWRPSFFMKLHEVLCQGLGYSTLDIKKYLAQWGYTGWVIHRGRLLAMEKETAETKINAIFLPAPSP